MPRPLRKRSSYTPLHTRKRQPVSDTPAKEFPKPPAMEAEKACATPAKAQQTSLTSRQQTSPATFEETSFVRALDAGWEVEVTRGSTKRGHSDSEEPDAAAVADVAMPRSRAKRNAKKLAAREASPAQREQGRVKFRERHTATADESKVVRGSEEDWARRSRNRWKQVELGKATAGYQAYLRQYPVGARPLGFPPTPDADRRDLSRKDFDAHLQVWRRFLHSFDPDDVEIPPGDR
jgi:hypothetical protein